MKVTDIDYHEYEILKHQADSFIKLLDDRSKYISVDMYSGLYVSATEVDLINKYKELTDQVNKLESAIMNWGDKNKSCYSDFIEKYYIRK